MDTASSKMSVLSNIVGYLEKLDKALDQFKAEHKDDFKNMFADVDDKLTGSIKSILGMSTQDLGKLTGIKDRIASAKENKAGVPELRAIAQDVNALFKSIGDREIIDIDKLFKGKGVKFLDRISILENTLDEFYMSFQFVTNSINENFGSGGMAGINAMSEAAQKEAQEIRDAARELTDAQKKLAVAQSDMASVQSGNKKIQEKYSIDLTADAVKGLIDEYEKLDKELKDGQLSATEYCEKLLKMSEVVIKLKNAHKTVGIDENFKDVLKSAEGYTSENEDRRKDIDLAGQLSLYATTFSQSFIDKIPPIFAQKPKYRIKKEEKSP
jgi:hypothetical protein